MKIIHIKNHHALPFPIKPNPEIFEMTVHSQWMVAQIIRKYPDFPVVSEGVDADITDAPSRLMSVAANIIFPNGIPDKLEQISPLQKEFLYENGGDLTLFGSGEIPAIYKSVQTKLTSFDPAREEEAIACAREAAMKRFGTLDNATILLVFGGAHNFKSLCEKEGFEYEAIETVSSSVSSELSDNGSLNRIWGHLGVKQPKYPILFPMIGSSLGSSLLDDAQRAADCSSAGSSSDLIVDECIPLSNNAASRLSAFFKHKHMDKTDQHKSRASQVLLLYRGEESALKPGAQSHPAVFPGFFHHTKRKHDHLLDSANSSCHRQNEMNIK